MKSNRTPGGSWRSHACRKEAQRQLNDTRLQTKHNAEHCAVRATGARGATTAQPNKGTVPSYTQYNVRARPP